MSEYIKIIDGRIGEHICGTPTNGMIPVPDGFTGVVGMDEREFDDKWTVRPLKDRVVEGLVAVAPEYTVENNEVRPKTMKELVDDKLVIVDDLHVFDGVGFREKTIREQYRDGCKPTPKGFRLVEDSTQVDGLNLVEMTLKEKVAASVITQETADYIESMNVRADRDSRFPPYDAAIARLNRKERGTSTEAVAAERALWDAYASALADVPEQAGFPWHIEWPVRADGVQI